MSPAARTRGSSQCVWKEQVLCLWPRDSRSGQRDLGGGSQSTGAFRPPELFVREAGSQDVLAGALATWCWADSGEGSSRFPCQEALVCGEARHLLTILYHHALPFVIQTASALAKLTSNRFHYILRAWFHGMPIFLDITEITSP